MVHYRCTSDTFRPFDRYTVRWLEWEPDFTLAQAYWDSRQSPLSHETWLEARDLGYRYAAVVEGGMIRSIAACWRCSDPAWELAAVGTREEFQRRGYAKAVCSFVTAIILEAGRTATCTTDDDNLAMQKTAESLGYQRTG